MKCEVKVLLVNNGAYPCRMVDKVATAEKNFWSMETFSVGLYTQQFACSLVFVLMSGFRFTSLANAVLTCISLLLSWYTQ